MQRPPGARLWVAGATITLATLAAGPHPTRAAPTRGSLWESPKERDQRMQVEREHSLAESLESLPEIRSARVHLADERAGTSAAVLLQLEGSGPADTPATLARRLVAAAVPRLQSQDIEIVVVPRRAPDEPRAIPAEQIHVGPFRVAQDDASKLRLLLGLLFGLNGVLALALMALWRRLRAKPGKLAAGESPSKPR